MDHFERAMKKIRPLSQELNWYQRTAEEFGRNILSSSRTSEVRKAGVLWFIADPLYDIHIVLHSVFFSRASLLKRSVSL
jgi:hypothetical protein